MSDQVCVCRNAMGEPCRQELKFCGDDTTINSFKTNAFCSHVLKSESIPISSHTTIKCQFIWKEGNPSIYAP